MPPIKSAAPTPDTDTKSNVMLELIAYAAKNPGEWWEDIVDKTVPSNIPPVLKTLGWEVHVETPPGEKRKDTDKRVMKLKAPRSTRPT